MHPDDAELTLTGGNMSTVVRVGSTVRRTAGPWTPTVHALLEHLCTSGVDGVPQPFGLDDRGRESLEFLHGEVPGYPMPEWVWREQTLIDAAQLLRRVHDATAGLVGLVGDSWQQPTHEPAEVICHNDFAPYNFVGREGELVGVIDWDMASPGPRVWDLAYLAYRLVPLTVEQTGAPASLDREHRLDLLLDSYGGIGREELLATLITRLLDLAAFSDEQALRRDRPELGRHAALYRQDAAALRDRSPDSGRMSS